jgi:VCBS repeat-containing protein
MSPSAFTFKVSVPNDPRQATVIGELAKHAAEYAKLDAGAAATFGQRVEALAVKALKAGSGNATTAVVTAADGTLTVTVGGESASHSL